MSAVTTMTASATATMLARLVALCSDFKLPTLANELIPRFQQAGHEDVLPLVLEVFELEAQDRLELGNRFGKSLLLSQRDTQIEVCLSILGVQPGRFLKTPGGAGEFTPLG